MRACPLVGYHHVLRVEVTGDADRVEMVQVCVEDECSPVIDPEPGEEPGSPSAIVPYLPPEQVEPGVWLAEWAVVFPDTVEVRALDVSGVPIAASVEPLEWERVGGSERCGGPTEAEVELVV